MRYGDREEIEKLERELAAARFINTSLAHAIESAKGHAGQIDVRILSDIVVMKNALQIIIKDDPDWLEVPEVLAAWELVQGS